MMVGDINLLLIDKIEDGRKVKVKIRYNPSPCDAMLYNEGNRIKVIFDDPQKRITPGQSAVFYIDDFVIGGGIINSSK